MGLHLIGFAWLDPMTWWYILQVVIGLGMVIFIHELGHFAVAKWCGVKCEKFYIGFDFFGLKLFKYQYGETEYGVGVFPLGGYVKMLGQEDNPAHLAQEIERAKLAQQARTSDGAEPADENAADTSGGEPPLSAEAIAHAEAALYDPRSYLAKSVPQRMAIISAGVVMNVIFAFVVASIAYSKGVEQLRCVVGPVFPGSPAWRAGLESGDEIVQIGDLKNPRFKDLQNGVIFGDNLDQGVPFKVKRPGVSEPFDVRIVPEREGIVPMIGIGNATSARLATIPFYPTSPLAATDADVRGGDVVVAFNDTPIADDPVEAYHQLSHLWLTNRGPVTLTLRREHDAKDGPADEIVRAEIPSNPMRRLGLVMAIGEVTALQDDSPASAAGIHVGDRITKIDGEPLGDPITLPERIAARAGKTVTLSVDREGESITIEVTPRAVDSSFGPLSDKSPMAVPSLGLTYHVTNRIKAIEPNGPAAGSGLKAGDEIVAVKLVPLGAEERAKLQETLRARYHDPEFEIAFDEEADFTLSEKMQWPAVAYLVHSTPPGTRVELTLADDRTVTVEPADSDYRLADRGLVFDAMTFTVRGQSIAECVRLGVGEGVESLTLVFRFLEKLVSRQVSVKGAAGPISIVRIAHRAASQGLSEFLIFLGLISANLAVVNFLPVPVLDGGHMVFLAAEGIRGKPISERIQLALTYAGLCFILTLMVFVVLLDVGVIPRDG